MARMLLRALLALAASSCHPGERRGTDPPFFDIRVGHWKDVDSDAEFRICSNGDFLAGDDSIVGTQWRRQTPELISIVNPPETIQTTVTSGKDGSDEMVLDWRAEGGLRRVTLVRLADECGGGT